MDYLMSARTLAAKLTFRDAVWLFPAAFALHVFEERPRFTNWARRNASDLFTQQDYDTIHLAGVIAAIVFAALMWRFPHRVLVFAFFAFVFAPGLFFNTFFHAGATVITREYCPGVITALTLYLPVFFFLSRLAWRENLMSAGALTAALIIGGAFHTWEVGHNVFKAW